LTDKTDSVISMKAYIVVAHLEPHSFNARLAGISNRTLASAGYDISFSDL
jgi:hypothetical protein